MINGLCGEYSAKTGQEKAEILGKLMLPPVINVDFTNASVNGKSAQVLVLASPSSIKGMLEGFTKNNYSNFAHKF